MGKRLAFSQRVRLIVSVWNTTHSNEQAENSDVKKSPHPIPYGSRGRVRLCNPANRGYPPDRRSRSEVATAAPVRAAPGAEIPANVVLPPESIQPITVDWNGPVESFLEDISQRAGYELVVTGRAPANQVMISINANNEPLFGVVRRAGNMVHGYADIGFNPGSKKIELRYGG